MNPEDAHYYDYERTPWWMFWMPPWRKKITLFGSALVGRRCNYFWSYAMEPK